MYHLSKRFRFETAHRLGKCYPGKCRNIHGHSWNGMITVEASTLDEYDFGVDFGLLKPFVKGIEDALDHGIILQASDVELVSLCERNDWKNVVLPDNPTCEVLARWIFHEAVKHFAKHHPELKLRVHCVQIEETCTSRCEYYGS